MKKGNVMNTQLKMNTDPNFEKLLRRESVTLLAFKGSISKRIRYTFIRGNDKGGI